MRRSRNFKFQIVGLTNSPINQKSIQQFNNLNKLNPKIFNSMKKTILSFVALCVGVFAMAQTSFYVYNSDGTTVEFVVAKVDSISFVNPTTGTANGYDWVDLGLPSGTKWATCNIGANNPWDSGNYYAWGETTTKITYFWDTYKYGDDYNGLTKYCTDSSYGKDGFTDDLTTLEATDDAATANWGEEWRMPTSAEWEELFDNCTCTWTDDYDGTGVAGRIVTSKTNGNTIFLPAAGYNNGGYLGYTSYYWSSSLSTDAPYGSDEPLYAYSAYFDSDFVSGLRYDYRYYGFSVRPVLR